MGIPCFSINGLNTLVSLLLAFGLVSIRQLRTVLLKNKALIVVIFILMIMGVIQIKLECI